MASKLTGAARAREIASDFVSHVGWMFHGQECDCGHNPFNGAARWFQKPAFQQYDDDLNALNWRTASTYWIGAKLADLSIWIIKDDLVFGEPEPITPEVSE